MTFRLITNRFALARLKPCLPAGRALGVGWLLTVVIVLSLSAGIFVFAHGGAEEPTDELPVTSSQEPDPTPSTLNPQPSADSTPAAAELLLWPDPAYTPRGRTALIEMRLSSGSEPIYGFTLLLNVSGAGELEKVFVMGAEDLYLTERAQNNNQIKLVFASAGGLEGTATIARLLIRVPELVRPGVVAWLKFDAASGAYDESQEPIAASLRDSAIRVRARDDISISSTTHPDEAVWYNKQNVGIKWEFAGERTYTYRITRIPTQRPDSEPNEPIGAIELRELDDGTWYFLLCELTGGEECTRPSSRRIMIDTTAPEEFDVAVRREKGRNIVEFWPYDAASGIAATQVSFNADAAENIIAWEDIKSPYMLPKGLVDDISFRATDNAGNERIVRIPAPSGLSAAVYAALATGLFFLLLAGGTTLLHHHKTKK